MAMQLFGGRQGGGVDPQKATSLQLVDAGLRADPEFVVGVIDTGVLVRDGKPHPFVAGHLAAGWRDNRDTVPAEGGRLGRYDGHGTFVAGLIHAESPTATIKMCRALDPPAGLENADNDEVVAHQIGVLGKEPKLKLVNLSFFGADLKEEHGPPKIRCALEALFAKNHDVLVLTAAGNHGTSTPVWPARFNRDFEHRVIAVGALDKEQPPSMATFSNFWKGIDAYALGARVLGPSVTGDYSVPQGSRPALRQTFTGWSLWSGTSFAAATVTGRLAQTMISQHLTGSAAWTALVAAQPSFVPKPGLPTVPYFGAGRPVTDEAHA